MIELRNIYKSYQMAEEGLVVLKDATLKIDSGEFVSIMGPSGSGKSTLLNILGLLDVPDSGSYKIYGREVANLNDDDLAILRREVFGFIFQQFNLLPRMNAVENVELPLIYSKGYLNVKTAKGLLDKVGLSDRLEHRPQQLSGGQQQRVAIARSLINGPRIILADEPTGNLDSTSGKEILAILRELNEQGITVIIVTHEEGIAKQARRLIRIHDGVITSDEVLQKEPVTNSKKEKNNSLNKPPAALSISEFVEHFKEGMKTLLANKVRTGLSILGILIGVAAVITMLALGTGAKKAIQEQLASLGSNLLVLRPGHVRVAGRDTADTSAIRVTMDDVTLIQQEIPAVKEAAPGVNGRAQVTYLDNNWSTQVLGSSASYVRMHSAYPEEGRFFTDQENKARVRVAVIGKTIVRKIFGEQAPVGEFIKINKVMFQVIGVLPERGATGFRDQDDVIIVPSLTAMYRLFGKNYVDYVDIEITNAEDMPQAQIDIKALVTKQHNIPLSIQQDAFEIRNMADIQSAMSETSKIMSMLLTAIAAVSLLVGGIGIMNIMLVSVTERTREIGLRKAVGARRRDILTQFLTEAGVIGIFGGMMGVIIGVLATFIMSQLAGWTTSISLSSVVVSFSFSVAIGVIFGIWPAKKASALNPIEALRSE
jgi:macrolide transport system ATP-binding/permease protein